MLVLSVALVQKDGVVWIVKWRRKMMLMLRSMMMLLMHLALDFSRLLGTVTMMMMIIMTQDVLPRRELG